MKKTTSSNQWAIRVHYAGQWEIVRLYKFYHYEKYQAHFRSMRRKRKKDWKILYQTVGAKGMESLETTSSTQRLETLINNLKTWHKNWFECLEIQIYNVETEQILPIEFLR